MIPTILDHAAAQKSARENRGMGFGPVVTYHQALEAQAQAYAQGYTAVLRERIAALEAFIAIPCPGCGHDDKLEVEYHART